MFSLTNFSVELDQNCIVNQVSLTAPSKGVVALLGPNGAGKSTLMKAIAGVLPFSGVKAFNSEWPDSSEIAFMPQDYLVRSSLSVLDCVLLGQRDSLKWRVTARQRQAVLDSLERLSISHLKDRPMYSLSGGQQQLVLLAQRLSKQPRLLLLDEPTSALDLQHQLEVMSHIRDYAHSHGALVICTLHDLTLAARFADHVALLKQGSLLAHGTTEKVVTRAAIQQVYNIDCDLLSARDNKLIIAPYQSSPTMA